MLRHPELKAFLLAVLLLATLPGCARKPARCWVCDREIHKQVMASIHLASGKTVRACCPRCALHYEESPGNKVRGIEVRDYVSGEDLPFQSAYFVEGSDEAPCMHHPPVMDQTNSPMRVCYDRCMPSLIAFRTPEEARAFMADHGGTVLAPGSLPLAGGAAGR